MALIILSPGSSGGDYGARSTDNVNGTSSGETVFVAANGKVVFDGSFNLGGDTINILGNAGDYSATISGTSLVLTASNGASILIPFGAVGVAVDFADTSPRTLVIEDGNLRLGDQVIANDGSVQAVAPGSGGSGGGGGSTGDEQFLTADQDVMDGTNDNDTFYADIVQVSGLQVNSLGTGDRVDGHAGSDTLEAQVTRGSTYGDGNAPIQPRLNDVEIVKLEALQSDLPNGFNNINTIATQANTEVFVNAKDIRGHDQIWSWESDANLTVQNLNTIVADGGHDDARNTSDITVGMGYTGSNDHNWNASDFHVFFDQDFLLSGQANESTAFYYLLDQDADLVGGPLLDNINVDGIRFTIDGGAVITLRDPDAQMANTHAGFIAALQDELQDLKDAGIVPADTTLTVDPTNTITTFLDDGSVSSPIPAIVLQTNTAAVFDPVGFSQVQDALGEYNVFGRLEKDADITDIPVSVQIALEKAGRGVEDCCDAGEMIVGSMDKDNNGIEVFNVTVYGDESRPSVLRNLDSTGGALDTMNITSDNSGYPDETTYASLTIGYTNEFMSLINASTFLGDLTLGGICFFGDFKEAMVSGDYSTLDSLFGGYGEETIACAPIYNLATLLATGGGDVTFYGEIDSSGVYSYTTGSGDDAIFLDIYGEALDFAGDSLFVSTGGGDDLVVTDTRFNGGNEAPNQIILQNVDIVTGDGNDTINTLGEGSFRIDAGTGNDTIYTDNSGLKATWVFNVDRGATYNNTSDLPGVPLQSSLIGGGRLRVTFSGAGSENGGGGGGVMELYGDGIDADNGEADFHVNGIESVVTINVGGPRTYYGTQADINDAMLRAINDDPVLNKLLTAYIADNNTLVVQSLIDGSFVTEDLDIEIIRPDFANYSASQTSAALAEARALGFADSTVVDFANPDTLGQPLTNGFYSGVDNDGAGTVVDPDSADPGGDLPPFENLISPGSQGTYETDNIINGGNGNDVIVLSTDDDDNIANSYYSLDGQLFDEASNEVIVMKGLFGSDTIINFQTAGVEDYAPEPGGPGTLPNSGFDFLDFTAYLTSKVSASGSTASANTVFVTLDDYSSGTTPMDFGSVTLDVNEVVVLDFLTDVPNGESFSGLTAAIVQSAINDVPSFTEFGNFDGGEFALDDSRATTGPGLLVNGSANAIIMVQNDLNIGEYKVFQVTWTDNSADTLTPPVASVTELGKLDFGTALVDLDEINLVGSSESFLFDGFGLNQFGPDSGILLG